MSLPTRAGTVVLVMGAVLFSEQARAGERSIPVAELDAALVRRVREFAGPALAAKVEISAHDGRVVLRGTVDSAEKRRMLEQKAEEIAGQKLDDQTQIAVSSQK